MEYAVSINIKNVDRTRLDTETYLRDDRGVRIAYYDDLAEAVVVAQKVLGKTVAYVLAHHRLIDELEKKDEMDQWLICRTRVLEKTSGYVAETFRV